MPICYTRGEPIGLWYPPIDPIGSADQRERIVLIKRLFAIFWHTSAQGLLTLRRYSHTIHQWVLYIQDHVLVILKRWFPGITPTFQSFILPTTVLTLGFLVVVYNLSSYQGLTVLSLPFLDRALASPQQVYRPVVRVAPDIVPMVTMKTLDTEALPEDVVAAAGSDQEVLLANVTPNFAKDPEEDGGVKTYTVQSGDTLAGIARNFNITLNTLLWSNDLDPGESVNPGDKVFILPVSGVRHKIADGDTPESLAKKFQADVNNLLAFNSITPGVPLEVGTEIIIPGGREETPVRTTTIALQPRTYADPNASASAPSSLGKPTDRKPGAGHRFPYGYCTWYVATKRYVPWGGNAGTWLYNSRAMGYKTGKEPVKGSIMVTTESPYYGHVAYVESVGKDTFTVSEMNYVGFAKKSTRTVKKGSRFIKGFVY